MKILIYINLVYRYIHSVNVTQPTLLTIDVINDQLKNINIVCPNVKHSKVRPFLLALSTLNIYGLYLHYRLRNAFDVQFQNFIEGMLCFISSNSKILYKQLFAFY